MSKCGYDHWDGGLSITTERKCLLIICSLSHDISMNLPISLLPNRIFFQVPTVLGRGIKSLSLRVSIVFLFILIDHVVTSLDFSPSKSLFIYGN